MWDDTSGVDLDGYEETDKQIDVYVSTGSPLTPWTLLESFNVPGGPQAMRFDKKTEIILTKDPGRGNLAFKLNFPNGYTSPAGNTIGILEIELYLSEEFEHLKKNHHLDLIDDSRPEDVLAFRRNLPDSNSMSGLGDVAGDAVTFTDTSFGGIAFCFHDLGKSITIDGETRKIVNVLPSGSTINAITVNSALSGAPKSGVAWDITASGADIDDGETK
jgi:hypothetical protein